MVSTGKEHPMNTGAWEHPKAFAEVGRTGKNKRFKAFGRKVMMMETICRLMHSRDYSNYGTKVPLYEHAGTVRRRCERARACCAETGC